MDIKKGELFDEVKEKEVPMSALNEEKVEVEASKAAESEQTPVAMSMEEKVEEAAPAKVVFGVDERIPLNIPEEDYKKNGALKKVRGRMLKKLLKQEMLHYLPLLLLFSCVILISAVYLRVVRVTTSNIPNYEMTYAQEAAMTTSIFLYVFSCFGALIYTQGYPIRRYRKNFLGNEGYLTFSIPASVEEHVLAKRLSAWFCTLLMGFVFFVSLFIVAPLSKEVLLDIFTIPDARFAERLSLIFFILEVLISMLIFTFGIQSFYAVYTCLFSKMSARKKRMVTFITVVVVMTLFQSCAVLGLVNGNLEIVPKTELGGHLLIWIGILFEAGLTLACTAVEVWYLKNKLDLQ